MQPRPCLVCGKSGARPLHGKADSLWRCRCGLVFVDPIPDADEISAREDEAFHGGLIEEATEMFSAYYRDFPDDPVVRGFRETIGLLHEMTGGGTLVDVGIGTGLLLHLAGERGFRAVGCEISAGAAAKAVQEFGVEVRVGDFLKEPFDTPPDAITMADVVEHTPDPRRFLEHAAEILRPGGALFVAVPNHRSTLYWAADAIARLPIVAPLARRLYVPNHYWYFTPSTLTRLVEECGFEVKEVRGESPYLGRYSFAPLVRFALATLIRVGEWTGLQGRVEIYATRRG